MLAHTLGSSQDDDQIRAHLRQKEMARMCIHLTNSWVATMPRGLQPSYATVTGALLREVNDPFGNDPRGLNQYDDVINLSVSPRIYQYSEFGHGYEGRNRKGIMNPSSTSAVNLS